MRPKVAAAHVGLGIRTLYALVSAGKIRPPYKVSKTLVLFRRDRLEADLDALCGHTTDD
jgi:hypothetical protein